jgi:hypothetical protein
VVHPVFTDETLALIHISLTFPLTGCYRCLSHVENAHKIIIIYFVRMGTRKIRTVQIERAYQEEKTRTRLNVTLYIHCLSCLTCLFRRRHLRRARSFRLSGFSDTRHIKLVKLSSPMYRPSLPLRKPTITHFC